MWKARLRCAGRKPSRPSAMLKTLYLVASGSFLPNSEGLAAEFSLTDRLTASRCWVNVLVHHRDRTRLPVCLALYLFEADRKKIRAMGRKAASSLAVHEYLQAHPLTKSERSQTVYTDCHECSRNTD